MRKILILLLLLCFVTTIFAKTATGFIVNYNNDTLFGSIKLHRFERVTGAFLINSYDINWCFFAVSFKAHNQKRFKNYKPNEIKSYEFTYKSANNVFTSFDVAFTSLINRENNIPRFLQLVYNDRISLYRDIVYSPQMHDKGEIFTYYDYYLYTETKGLVRVNKIDKKQALINLLRKFNIEDEFIATLPANVNSRDIVLILKQYTLWLNEQ